MVSVDGPGRLTLKGSRGTFKTKLYGVDVPSPGECGATESTATLSRLAKRERGRVTYVLWGRKTDAEGRYSAIIGPRQTDLIENSIGRDLVESEWARAQLPVTISEMDDITMSVASDA